MRKRVQVALAVLVVALISVTGWQVLRKREPVYQGKGLREWLIEYSRGSNTGTEKQVQARNAVRRIGTNAIPTLLTMLRERDSTLASRLKDLWDRRILRLRYLSGNEAEIAHNQAVTGFQILGADAQQTVSALIDLCGQNISPTSQRATMRALFAVGPGARKAIPSFLLGAASSDPQMRQFAVVSLSRFHTDQRLVVPALTRCLGDTNIFVRADAALGLGGFGMDAQQAVPALVQALNDQNGQVRRAATEALKQIDPEAAARAGVKRVR